MEIWKDIKNYEGRYQISNYGKVKSLARWIGNQRYVKEKILVLNKDRKGYLRVGLSKNGKCLTRRIHRLVAQAFIPNPLNLPQVNHLDGRKNNNYVNNLEWVNSQTNNQHGYDIGLHKPKRGIENGNVN